eukprot:2215274-Pleurochrysis_carterae.AAC.5
MRPRGGEGKRGGRRLARACRRFEHALSARGRRRVVLGEAKAEALRGVGQLGLEHAVDGREPDGELGLRVGAEHRRARGGGELEREGRGQPRVGRRRLDLIVHAEHHRALRVREVGVGVVAQLVGQQDEVAASPALTLGAQLAERAACERTLLEQIFQEAADLAALVRTHPRDEVKRQSALGRLHLARVGAVAKQQRHHREGAGARRDAERRNAAVLAHRRGRVHCDARLDEHHGHVDVAVGARALQRRERAVGRVGISARAECLTHGALLPARGQVH